MKKSFCPSLRGLLLLAAAAMSSLVPVHAAPICNAGTAASYVFLGGDGCQLGNLLFNNFVYTPTANPATIAIPGASVAIIPIPAFFDEGFGFQIASGFAATAPGSFVDSVLQFTVSTLDGSAGLTGLSLNTNGTSTGTGLASVSENFCVGGTSTVNCAALRNISVQSVGGSGLNNSAILGGVARLGVSKDIIVSAGNSGTATISLVGNQFSNNAVPEPATFALIGLGLGGIALARRRRAA